ncbi:MAG: hypothetical protein LBB77_05980 [Treponema sp.]|jgi:hypothetical protein|nr:hypothetical protein [Treponema sp.]
MSKFYSSVLFVCSLAAGGALFFFSLRSLPVSGQGRFEGYAALSLEEDAPDREIAGALEAALGRPVVSESSQWVFLNSFEGLERVPLEDYENRLEALDPRRDGYAEKLTNFFVRGGRRWFFIPLDRKLFGSLPVLNPGEQLKKRIAAALNTVSGSPGKEAAGPFSLLMRPRGQPLGLRILLFTLAWAAVLVFPSGNRRDGRQGPRESGFSRVRRFFRRPFAGIPRERRRLLFLVPLTLPLSLWGAPGFACTALSLFLGTLLADPLTEYWLRFLGRARPGPRTGPYRFRLFYSLPLVLFLVLIPWIGGMPPLWVFLNFLGLSLCYFCSLGLEIRRKFSPFPVRDRGKGPSLYGSCRFVPLPILPLRLSANPLPSVKGSKGEASVKSRLGSQAFPFPGRKNRGNGFALPFALASCLAAFSGSLGGFSFFPPPPASADWAPLVGEEDYRAHVLFQAGFAYRPLQSGDGAAGYFRYTLGEDGLVAETLPVSFEESEIPLFPLAGLSSYLAAWDSGEPGGIRGIEFSLWPAIPLADLVSPFLAFLLVLPTIAGRGRGWKRVPAYYDKRIAA